MSKHKIAHIGSVFLVLILALCSVLSLTASATAYEDNLAAIKSANDTLSAQRIGYSEEDHTPNKDIAKRVNTYITNYTSLIDGLHYHAEITARPLTPELELYTTQGTVAGQTAWIFYSTLDTPEREETYPASPLEVHTRLQEQIKDATNPTSLGELAVAAYDNGGIYATMYVSVYHDKLEAIQASGTQSDAVKQIIAAAKSDIERYANKETSVTDYATTYQNAKKNVAIQRNRDAIVADLLLTQSILAEAHPERAAQINSKVTAAIGYINAKSLTKDMYVEYVRALEDILSPLKTDVYVSRFIDEYLDAGYGSVSRMIAEAAEGTVVPVSSLFDAHAIRYLRAVTRNSLSDDLSARAYASDPVLAELFDEYARNGGVFDSCADKTALDFALAKAKRRADYYGDYLAYSEQIENKLSPYDDTDLQSLAKDQYEFHDYQLSQAADTERLNGRYEIGRTALATLVTRAETEHYRQKHATILGTPTADVTATPEILEALQNAITDAAHLSNNAKAELKPELSALADKYKRYAKDAIADSLGTDGDRALHAAKLGEQVDLLGLSNNPEQYDEELNALSDKARDILAKASMIDRLYDHLEGIQAKPEHRTFRAEDVTKLKKDADDAAKRMIASDKTGDALDDFLDSTYRDAVLALDRDEAAARIRAAAGTDTLDAITAIVGTAIGQIETETDADKIKQIADKAVFDITSEKKIQDVTDTVKDAKDEIGSLPFLDQADKDAATKPDGTLDALLKEAIDDIRHADYNENKRQEAIDDLKEAVQTLVNEAKTKDTADEAEQRKNAADAVDRELTNAEDRINELDHLTENERDKLKEEAQSIRDNFQKELENASNSDEVNNAVADAVDELGKHIADAVGANEAAKSELESAKDKAKNDNDLKADDAEELLDGFIFMKDPDKEQARAELDSLLTEHKAAIDACTSVDEVETARETAIEAIKVFIVELEQAEKEATVRFLLPIIMALAVLLVIELAAWLILLALIKKAQQLLASLLPIPTALAVDSAASLWSLLGVLTLADILLAVAVVRSAMQYARIKRIQAEAEQTWPAPEQLPIELEAETAEEPQPQIQEAPAVAVTLPEPMPRKRRAEINLDTISEQYTVGEEVNIDTLKEKELISQRANYVKVLARGDLDKPLTVTLQAYSVAAKEKIKKAQGAESAPTEE